MFALFTFSEVCSPACLNNGICRNGQCVCTVDWEGDHCQNREYIFFFLKPLVTVPTWKILIVPSPLLPARSTFSTFVFTSRRDPKIEILYRWKMNIHKHSTELQCYLIMAVKIVLLLIIINLITFFQQNAPRTVKMEQLAWTIFVFVAEAGQEIFATEVGAKSSFNLRWCCS